MSKLHAFASEMEKVAKYKIPTVAITSGMGAALGAKRGFEGAINDQWKDDDRLRQGLISSKEWKDRRDFRVLRGISTTALGGSVGATLPHLAGRARAWVIDSAREAAKPLGDQFENSSQKVVKNARRELSEAMDQHTKKLVHEITNESENIGRGAGRGIKKSLREGGEGIPIDHRVRAPWRK